LVLNYPFYFAAAFLLLVNAFIQSWSLSEDYQGALWILPVLGFVAFGIPHGAVDHKLNPGQSNAQFYGMYILGLLSFLILWLISPWLSMLVFIFISSDHFGENQFLRALKISRNQLMVRGLTILWGLSASLMAPLFHWDSAKPILQTLLRNSQFGEFLAPAQAGQFGLVLAVLSIGAAKLISVYEERALGRRVPGALSTIALVFTFWALPLIPGFLTFFCFWHSWDTIIQQKKSLRWSSKNYFLAAVPYSAVATVGLVAVVYFFDRLESLQSYMFLLLGALTVSHAFVMKRFYQL
jgi:Brp/Blh family beta-carotene 15,15'-monooxygenase